MGLAAVRRGKAQLATGRGRSAFALFETAVGACGIAWSERGLTCVQLPGRTRADTRERMLAQTGAAGPAEPPAWVVEAMARIARHLEGTLDDLASLPLDEEGVPPFHRRVYEATRRLGPGQTATYGAIARQIGSDGAARAVGGALGSNPWSLVIPCHRVLASDGKMCGFSAEGGVALKARLLALEGALPLERQARLPLATAAKAAPAR